MFTPAGVLHPEPSEMTCTDRLRYPGSNCFGECMITLPPASATFHPLNPADTANPFEKLDDLRATCPISRPQLDGQPELTFFTRYGDVAGIYRDYRTWGNLGVSVDVEHHKTLAPESLSAIAADPPLHTRIRRLMLTAVAPSAIEANIDFIRHDAATRTAELPAAQSVDIVPTWTAVIPSAAITHVMGLPQEDRPKFHAWTKTLIQAADATKGKFDSGQVIGEFFAYISNEIARRRANPAAFDDVISRMVEFKDPNGEGFQDFELCNHVITILLAGNDTTAHLLANLVRRLAEQPELYARLRAKRELVSLAIEESLRYDPPQQDFPRRCLRSTTVGGFPFERDDVAVVSIVSANRDEEHFEHPNDFDINRSNNRDHVAFGMGIHLCVGAHLARRTTEVAVNALLDRFDRIELDPEWSFHNGGYYRFWGPGDLRVILPCGLSMIDLRIDLNLCMGARECVHIAPHVFSLNADNQAQVIASADDADEELLVDAAASCPNFAIAVTRDGRAV